MANQVRERWGQLCSKYTSDATLVYTLWEELEKAYSAAGRYYHNLHHLAFMLQLAEENQEMIIEPDALRFAIFYHDIVCDSTKPDNEEKSAALAGERLNTLRVDPVVSALVKEMILATKRHQPHSKKEVNLLLDLDLAILGTEWERYDAYRKQVRKEFEHLPDATFNRGRSQVLQHFLHQPQIYKTEVFRHRLEAQARHNLEKESALLSDQGKLR